MEPESITQKLVIPNGVRNLPIEASITRITWCDVVACGRSFAPLRMTATVNADLRFAIR